MNNKNKKLIRQYRPNRFIWFLYTLLSKIICKKRFYNEVEKTDFINRNKDEGCILLFNHNCNSDFWFLGNVLGNKNKANIVVTKRFKYLSPRNFLLNNCKVIYYDQFVPNINAILQIKKALQCKNIVGIAPTGTVTIHGGQLPIFPATIKLLKKFNVDVYYVQSLGSYIADPKWAVNKRKYPVKTTVIKLFSKDDLKNLSNEACMEKLLNIANINDQNTRVYPDVQIKGKNITQGLEKILYLCPKCLNQNIVYHDDLIECMDCHNQVRYNRYGYLEAVTKDSFTYKTELEWYHFQANYYLEKLKQEDFHLQTKVNIYTDQIDKDQFICAGSGILYFNKQECYYEGEYLDEEHHTINKRIDFSLLVPELSYVPYLRFNIPNENGMFEFIPEDKKEVMRWVQIWEVWWNYNNLK